MNKNLPRFVRIEGQNLVRDTQSMAIINTDSKSRDRYRDQYNRIMKDKLRISKLEDEVSILKSLVQSLLEKNNA